MVALWNIDERNSSRARFLSLWLDKYIFHRRAQICIIMLKAIKPIALIETYLQEEDQEDLGFCAIGCSLI